MKQAETYTKAHNLSKVHNADAKKKKKYREQNKIHLDIKSRYVLVSNSSFASSYFPRWLSSAFICASAAIKC